MITIVVLHCGSSAPRRHITMDLAKISVLVLAAATLAACVDFQGELNTIGGFPRQQAALNQFGKAGGILPGSANGFYGNENRMVYHPPTGKTVQDFINAYRAAQTPKREFVPIHEPRQEPPNRMPAFPPFQGKQTQPPVQGIPPSFQVAAPHSSYSPYSIGNQQIPAVQQKFKTAIPIVQIPSAGVPQESAIPISYQYSATKYADTKTPNLFIHSNAFGANSGQFDAAKSIGQQLTVNQGYYPLKSYDEIVTVPPYGRQGNVPSLESNFYKTFGGYAAGGFNSQGNYVSTSGNGAGPGFKYPVIQKPGHDLVGYQFGNYAPKLSHTPALRYTSVNSLTNKINKNIYGKNANGFSTYKAGFLKSSFYPLGMERSKLNAGNGKGVYLTGKF